DSLFEGNGRLLGEAQGSTATRVGHGHHEIGLHGRLAGKLPPQRFPHEMNILPEYAAGRIGKINVFENTMRPLRGRQIKSAAGHAVLVQSNYFARFDFAHAFRSDRVKRTGFAGHAPSAIGGLAQHEGADSPWVTTCLDPIWKQKQETESPLQVFEHMRQWI